jgi:hypothetical protein
MLYEIDGMCSADALLCYIKEESKEYKPFQPEASYNGGCEGTNGILKKKEKMGRGRERGKFEAIFSHTDVKFC